MHINMMATENYWERRRTWARDPFAGILDMDLAGRMVVAQEAGRESGNHVFFVVNVGHRHGLCVDVVRKCLVAYPRESVSNELHRDSRNVERKVDDVKKAERGTYEDRDQTK